MCKILIKYKQNDISCSCLFFIFFNSDFFWLLLWMHNRKCQKIHLDITSYFPFRSAFVNLVCSDQPNLCHANLTTPSNKLTPANELYKYIFFVAHNDTNCWVLQSWTYLPLRKQETSSSWGILSSRYPQCFISNGKFFMYSRQAWVG